MKHFVALPTSDGGVELHPMKSWLRRHAAELPPAFPLTGTSRQMRRALVKSGWSMHEGEYDVRLFRPGHGASTKGGPALLAREPSLARKPLVGERAWVR
ncbi:MAG TPA: hypothetical protein VGO40_12980, partial [Longimicrobium sp.]|nr:hypothetical protein [Longimicrobium sp.]